MANSADPDQLASSVVGTGNGCIKEPSNISAVINLMKDHTLKIPLKLQTLSTNILLTWLQGLKSQLLIQIMTN